MTTRKVAPRGKTLPPESREPAIRRVICLGGIAQIGSTAAARVPVSICQNTSTSHGAGKIRHKKATGGIHSSVFRQRLYVVTAVGVVKYAVHGAYEGKTSALTFISNTLNPCNLHPGSIPALLPRQTAYHKIRPDVSPASRRDCSPALEKKIFKKNARRPYKKMEI